MIPTAAKCCGSNGCRYGWLGSLARAVITDDHAQVNVPKLLEVLDKAVDTRYVPQCWWTHQTGAMLVECA